MTSPASRDEWQERVAAAIRRYIAAMDREACALDVADDSDCIANDLYQALYEPEEYEEGWQQ